MLPGFFNRPRLEPLGKNCYSSLMVATPLLASGSGWRFAEVVCTSGPCDKPFEERHDGVCLAAVMEGTFRYRSTQGTALLSPGAVLLGDHNQCFECGHEHGIGDRCLSFHFTPEFLEAVVASVPGARRITFTVPCLPPLPALIPLIAAAEAERDNCDALEELALRFAGAVSAALASAKRKVQAPSARDGQRISDALRRIEAEAQEPLSVADLAREAAMSPYYFLRTFHAVVGITPYQYVLRTRLHRAAVRLRWSQDRISDIAFDTGFNDLSTFNRRFERLIGQSPSAYRMGKPPSRQFT